MSTHKKDAIFQEILERLLTGRYRFGDRILVKEISEETGVSRQPIMTALYNLQERGFVRITAQVGCEVVSPTPEGVADFYRMFAIIEGLIGELAASRASAEDIRLLRFINEGIANIDPDRPDRGEAYRKLNIEFHTQLHSMARSPLVCQRQLANFELSDFLIVQTCGFDFHLDDATDEHAFIIDAIAQGDAERARQASHEHIASVARNVAASLAEKAEALPSS